MNITIASAYIPRWAIGLLNSSNEVTFPARPLPYRRLV